MSNPALAPPPRRPPATDGRLDSIAQRIISGERLSVQDGLRLYETPDIWTVCSLANLVRRRMHGDKAYYNINRHINYSNICALSCTFCSFYRKKEQTGAYEYSIDEIAREAAQAAGAVRHGIDIDMPIDPLECRKIKPGTPAPITCVSHRDRPPSALQR